MRGERSQSASTSFRILMSEGTVGGLGDGPLLERFAAGCGEPSNQAFAAIVARHGSVVLEVCRSILRHPEDVEDAFQATFLVLARRARSLRDPERLGPWLYGVALRTAREARARAARWHFRARREPQRRLQRRLPIAHDSEDRTGEEEASHALHEEIERLPERYREALVLCYFEGLTHADAAKRLACAEATVSVRLMRARERLRTRLNRRGLASSLPLALDRLDSLAFLSVPQPLADATARAVAEFVATPAKDAASASSAGRLAFSVLRSFRMPRVSSTVAFVSAVLVVVGGAVLARQIQEPGSAPASDPPHASPSSTASAPRIEGAAIPPSARPTPTGPGSSEALTRIYEESANDLDQQRLDLEFLTAEVSFRRQKLSEATTNYLNSKLSDERAEIDEASRFFGPGSDGSGNPSEEESRQKFTQQRARLREMEKAKYHAAREGLLRAQRALSEAQTRLMNAERRAENEAQGAAAGPTPPVAAKSSTKKARRPDPTEPSAVPPPSPVSPSAIEEVNRRLSEIENKLDEILKAIGPR